LKVIVVGRARHSDVSYHQQDTIFIYSRSSSLVSLQQLSLTIYCSYQCYAQVYNYFQFSVCTSFYCCVVDNAMGCRLRTMHLHLVLRVDYYCIVIAVCRTYYCCRNAVLFV